MQASMCTFTLTTCTGVRNTCFLTNCCQKHTATANFVINPNPNGEKSGAVHYVAEAQRHTIYYTTIFTQEKKTTHIVQTLSNIFFQNPTPHHTTP